jgi:hypothetical protein
MFELEQDLNTWPPTGRRPTSQELATGVAIEHDDGTVSWSPTGADLDWTDADELRASGHPAAQPVDFEPSEARR